MRIKRWGVGECKWGDWEKRREREIRAREDVERRRSAVLVVVWDRKILMIPVHGG